MGAENINTKYLSWVGSDNSAQYPNSLAGTFYYNEEGRRIAMQQMMKVIHKIDTPCSILIVTDDNLEWLLSDYMLSKQLQSDLMEILEKGFTLYQIMSAMNFLPRYTESLQFWLPCWSLHP